MDIVCTLLIANLCIGEVPGVSKLTITGGGLWSDATLESPDWRATIHLRDDNPHNLISSKLSMTCTDDVCVHYFKTCIQSAAAPSCTWNFTTASPWIRIDAESEHAMADAEKTIAVVAPGSMFATYRVRLAALDQVSAGPPPICKWPHGPGEIEVALSAGASPLHYFSDDILQFYPEPALRRLMDGRARVRCDVSGLKLSQCSVLSESPEGFRFGASAAEAAASLARVDPANKDASLDIDADFRVTPQGRLAAC
jgi:hypothetical protein